MIGTRAPEAWEMSVELTYDGDLSFLTDVALLLKDALERSGAELVVGERFTIRMKTKAMRGERAS